MCKCLKNFAKLAFGFLLFSCASFLSAEPVPGFTSTQNTPASETALNQQTPGNYNGNSEPLPPNLNGYNPPLIDPNNPWQDLRKWISEGLRGLDESSESLTMLQEQLQALKAETREQERLLRQSAGLLMSLKRSLAEAQNSVDIAVDRMQDAEDYALWIDARNEMLSREAERYRKSGIIGFSFGAVSFGIGTPLIVEGIRSDNQTMMWSGAGAAIGTGLVWTIGHYVFQWW